MAESRMMADLLELPQRTVKPRRSGRTIVYDRGWGSADSGNARQHLDYFDQVNSTAQCLLLDEETTTRNIRKYRELGIDVSISGLVYQLVVLQGKREQFLHRCLAVGINVMEAKPQRDLDEEVADLKQFGFKVSGRVGAKWYQRDETRPEQDQVDVNKVIDRINALLAAGVEYVHWEAMAVRALIGNRLENTAGQQQLLEVAGSVDKERLVFEVSNLRVGGGAGSAPQWGWLIHRFGPNVNIGGCQLGDLPLLEQARIGLSYDPDYPLLRWLGSGKPTPEWWQIEMPDYAVDIQPR